MTSQSKATLFYLKHFVKKPVGYFAVVVFYTFALIVLFMFIRIPTVTTLTVQTSADGDICTVAPGELITKDKIDKLYLYEDRNNYVYEIDAFSVIDNTVVFRLKTVDEESVFHSEQCYLEVWSGDHSLLYEIFVQGGGV